MIKNTLDDLLTFISEAEEELTPEQFDNVKYAVAQIVFEIEYNYLAKNRTKDFYTTKGADE